MKQLLFTLSLTLFMVLPLRAQTSFATPKLVMDNSIGIADLVQFADLDGDTLPDLVTVLTGGLQLVWKKQTENGEFNNPITIATSAPNTTIVYFKTHDIDNDGDTDILVGFTQSSQLALFYNNGNGSFANATWVEIGLTASVTFAIADMDNDNLPDIVLLRLYIGGNPNTQLIILKNSLADGFIETTIVSNAININGFYRLPQIYPYDIQKDGLTDLFILSSTGFISQSVVSFKNLGANGWSSANSYIANNKNDIHLIDYDQDGSVDILYSIYGVLKWRKGYASDTYGQEQTILTLTGYNAIANIVYADFNKTSQNSFLVQPFNTNLSGAHIFVQKNSNAWHNHQELLFPDHVVPLLYLADFNNDGYLDLFGVDAFTGKVYLYKNTRYLFDVEKKLINADMQSSWNRMVVADFNGDTHKDIVVGAYVGIMTLFLNDGETNFAQADTIFMQPDADPWCMVAADLDADGDTDILWGSQCKEAIYWLENDGNANFSEPKVINNDTKQIIYLNAFDFNNDGLPDILATSLEDGIVAWYKNLGSGVFSERIVIDTRPSRPLYAFAADLDYDGKLDILVSYRYFKYLVWYKNLGDDTFSAAKIIDNYSNSWSEIFYPYAYDLTGDGLIEPFLSNIYYYTTTDSIEWQRQSISPSGWGASNVLCHDLDQDGDLDLIYFAETGTEIGWQENIGSGIFNYQNTLYNSPTWYEIIDFNVFSSTVVTDLDNDSDLDIIAMMYYDFKFSVVWIEQLTKMPQPEIEQPTNPDPTENPDTITTSLPTRFTLFPNPTQRQLTITIPAPLPGTVQGNNPVNTVVLFNLLGRVVQVIPFENEVFAQEVDVAHLSNGMYIAVYAQNGKATQLTKLIIAGNR